MSTSTLTFQVSVEQIAEAIKQMSQAELIRLLELVPKLRSLCDQANQHPNGDEGEEPFARRSTP